MELPSPTPSPPPSLARPCRHCTVGVAPAAPTHLIGVGTGPVDVGAIGLTGVTAAWGDVAATHSILACDPRPSPSE
jgi:tetrahydromethanopterin S-methyltransferase subunit D